MSENTIKIIRKEAYFIYTDANGAYHSSSGGLKLCSVCSRHLSSKYDHLISHLKEKGLLDEDFEMLCCGYHNILINDEFFHVVKINEDKFDIVMGRCGLAYYLPDIYHNMNEGSKMARLFLEKVMERL